MGIVAVWWYRRHVLWQEEIKKLFGGSKVYTATQGFSELSKVVKANSTLSRRLLC